MHIGLAGGTFNPIHNGHLQAANEILKRFRLDTIIFIPSARPPHKNIEETADPLHRFCMVVIATLDHPKFLVSSFELQRKESSYSINTVRAFKEQYGEKTDLYFIIGIDAFAEIHTWKDPDLLLKNCHFIVTSRPGHENHNILDVLKKNISSRYKNIRFDIAERKNDIEKIRISRSDYFINNVKIPALNISSTDIRVRVSKGEPLSGLVPKGVEAYIKKNGLYVNTNSKEYSISS